MLVGDAADQHLGALEDRVRISTVTMRFLDGLGVRLMTRCAFAIVEVWRAIISSSLVGITHTATLLSGVLMRGPPAWLAAGIERHAQPGRVAADALADRRRVLADARGEDQRVDAAGRAASEPSSRPSR